MNEKQHVYPVYETNAWHSLDKESARVSTQVKKQPLNL